MFEPYCAEFQNDSHDIHVCDVMFLFCAHCVCVCVYRAAGLWLAVYRVACMEIVSIKAGSGPSIC